MSKTTPKYQIVRKALIVPRRRGPAYYAAGNTTCDGCVAGKLRCTALAHSGAVLPCENVDTLDVARMTQLYGADGAKMLMEVGNE